MSVETDKPFSYFPLPSPTSIRLVRRHGIDANGMINISIKVIDLAAEPWTSPYDRRDIALPKRPQFHCLSYTWGNPHAKGNGFEDSFKAYDAEYKDLVDIKCDGKILKIQKNLHHFFREAPTDWVRSIRGRIRPHTGKNLLHDEAASGNYGVVHMYAGQGIDVNVQDHMGRSPLHYAANNGMLETTRILVKAGAKLDLKDNECCTAEDLAATNHHEDIAELLRMCRTEDAKKLVKNVPEFVVEYSDTYIWIDAICIDQTNHEEREAQVRIMNDIYSMATYTIIWLGEEDKYTNLALSAISKLVGSAKEFRDSDLIPYRTYSPEDYSKFSVPFISQEEWNALASIFLRQWFRRIWVIQEAVFASGMIMYCGSKDMGWNNLQIVAEVIDARDKVLGYNASIIYVPTGEIASSIESYLLVISNLKEAARDSENASLGPYFELNRLINLTFPFRATDPRDNIYALRALSLLDPNTKCLIRPNYSIPVEQCYASFTKLLMNQMDSAKILSDVQDSLRKQIPGLPSWVPDFSLSGTNQLFSKCFSTSGDLHKGKSVFNPSLEWNELGLEGVCVDVIVHTAAPRLLGGPNKKFELDQSWFDLLQLIGTRGCYDNLNQSPAEVLWRTLCADMDLENNSPAPSEFSYLFKQFLCAMICTAPEMAFREEEATRENSITLAGLLHSAWSMRTEGCTDPQSRGPDESTMARLRDTMPPLNRSINGKHFDCMRHILARLEEALSKDLEEEKCIPTADEIDEYFRNSKSPLTRPNGQTEIPFEMRPYVLAHSNAYGGRRLFVTKLGYLGLGPASLDIGDNVWIIPGLNLPLLLRDCPDTDIKTSDPRRLSLVGEAYIHGIVRGEAVEKLTDEDLTGFILS